MATSTGSSAASLRPRTCSKELFDGALPSSSAIAAQALARLGALSGRLELSLLAERTVGLGSSMALRQPLAVPELILALGWLEVGLELVAPGPAGPLLDAARRCYSPFTVFVHGEAALPLLEGREPGLAYLCRHRSCQLPVAEPALLVAQLRDAVQG